MKAYLDTSRVIYFLEHQGALGLAASRHLAQVVSGGYQLVISDLVELECRVLPLKGKEPVQLRAIVSFCCQPGIENSVWIGKLFSSRQKSGLGTVSSWVIRFTLRHRFAMVAPFSSPMTNACPP